MVLMSLLQLQKLVRHFRLHKNSLHMFRWKIRSLCNISFAKKFHQWSVSFVYKSQNGFVYNVALLYQCYTFHWSERPRSTFCFCTHTTKMRLVSFSLHISFGYPLIVINLYQEEVLKVNSEVFRLCPLSPENEVINVSGHPQLHRDSGESLRFRTNFTASVILPVSVTLTNTHNYWFVCL